MEENEVTMTDEDLAINDADEALDDADDWSEVEKEALEMEDEEDKPDFDSEYSNNEETPAMEEKENNIPVDRTFDYTYMGETKKASMDDEDFVSTYQKGKNYDNLKDKFENDRARNFIAKLAQEEGKTVDEYIDLTEASLKHNEIEQIMDDEDVSEELAKEIYSYRQTEKQNAFANERIVQEQEKQRNNEVQFNDFINAYPNVRPEEIPVAVWDKFNNGVPLKYAYMEFENSQLKTNYNQLKTNATNRQQEVTVGNQGVANKVKESWESIWDED